MKMIYPIYSILSLLLTHYDQVTHICVGELTIIGSDKGLSPDRRQAIIRTNAGILSIGPLGTKPSEILMAIHIFSFKKMHLKMSSGKWRPSCLGLNLLIPIISRPYCKFTTQVLAPNSGTSLDASCRCWFNLIDLNTLRPRQNGRHFPDDIFKWIFLNENVWISIEMSWKFVPSGPISNIPALVQIMAWRQPGNKPLSEQMMVSLPTHICVARPQWVKVSVWVSYWIPMFDLVVITYQCLNACHFTKCIFI